MGTDTGQGKSLYERLGGEQAIMAAVALFYDKVVADPSTQRFFNGMDMEAQSRKLVGFMAWAFGGPEKYKGRDLRMAHAALVKEQQLGDREFDAVARHLEATLKELGVAGAMVQEALTIVGTTRNAVLGR